MDGVYAPLPKNVLSFDSFFDLFLAVPMGIQSCAGLIAILLVCTGAVDAGIGPLYVCLEYGNVPLKPWLKFFTPLVGLIYLAGFAALAVAVAIGY